MKRPSKLGALQARVLQGVAHPVRVAIVDLLRDGEVCVCDIAQRVDAERSNVSRHLAIMQRAGVVTSRKEGLKVFYSLRCPCVANLLTAATGVLEHELAEQQAALR